MKVPTKDLKISSCNIRTMTKKDKKELDGLKSTIKSSGIIQPLIVRKVKGKYEVVVGQRRFLAVKQARLKEVPCIIKKLTDQEALEYSLIENLQRKDVDAIDVAEGLNKWFDEEAIKKYGKNAPDLPITMEVTSKLAKTIGLTDRQVRSYLSLVNLIPELKEMVSDGKITIESGAKLKQLDEEAQKEFSKEFSKVLEEKPITQTEEEEIVSKIRKEPTKIKEIVKKVAETMLPEHRIIEIKIKKQYFDYLSKYAEKNKKDVIDVLEEIIIKALKKWGYKI